MQVIRFVEVVLRELSIGLCVTQSNYFGTTYLLMSPLNGESEGCNKQRRTDEDLHISRQGNLHREVFLFLTVCVCVCVPV